LTDTQSPQTLPEVVAYARSMGLTKVKVGDIEVELGPAPIAPAAKAGTDEEMADFFGDGPTEEQILLWSCGDGPPTEQERRAYEAAHPEMTPKPKRKHRSTKKAA
jgi:hypothetical protein